MLYYTILLYIILYYTILYCTVLYYTILHYTVLYYTILYYNYTILYYTILYYTALHYTVLSSIHLFFTSLPLFISLYRTVCRRYGSLFVTDGVGSVRRLAMKMQKNQGEWRRTLILIHIDISWY